MVLTVSLLIMDLLPVLHLQKLYITQGLLCKRGIMMMKLVIYGDRFARKLSGLKGKEMSELNIFFITGA